MSKDEMYHGKFQCLRTLADASSTCLIDFCFCTKLLRKAMYRFAYTFELHLLASKSTSILFPTPSNPNPTLICSSLSLSPPPHATHLSIRAQLKQHIMLIPIGPPNTRTRKRAVPTNSSRSPNTPLPPPLRNNNRIA